ncbi:zinc metalloproteinase-disintegrin-like BITM06A [Brevipalpus obovatus]|uniref:zinc metalloproteinase-disintegrin-like BITM06A n=1 Tax=Brevipalpus obovatus TaxID=246614 RepID=UPI003D9E9607
MDSAYIFLILSIVSSVSPADDLWNEQSDIQPNWITNDRGDKPVLGISIDDQNFTIPLRGAPFCRLWVTHKCDCYVLDQYEKSNWTMAFFSYCNGTIRGSLTNKREFYKIFPKNLPEKGKDSSGQHHLKKFPLIDEQSKIPSLDNDTLPWPDGTEDHEIESELSLRRPEMEPYYGMEYIKVFFAVDANIKRRHGNSLDYYLQSLVSLGSQYYQEEGYLLVYQGWKTAKSNEWSAVMPFVLGYDYSYYQGDVSDSDIIVLFLDAAQYPKGNGLGAVGLAIIDSACSVRRGIYVHNFEDKEILSAVTLTHEIGHMLGLRHTTETRCAAKCQANPNDPDQKQCIMNPMLGNACRPFEWSECSEKYLSDKKSTHFCFRKKIKSPKPMCGDGLVDPGEQCDCIQQECKACCKDCKLIEGKKCANGACCDLGTCQFKEGSVCRPTRNTCDFEEICDGQSGECPTDYVVADGYPCEDGQQGGYCSDGVCGSRNDMCEWMFKKGTAGDMKCYDKNMEGTSFAACGPEFNVECSKR